MKRLFATHRARSWWPGLKEIIVVLAALGICQALIFLSAWWDSSVTGIAAGLTFLGLLIALLSGGILALWRRQWLAGLLRVFAVPVCFVGGILVMFLANLAGGAALGGDFRTRTLPIDQRAMEEIREEGERIAADLSKYLPLHEKFALRAIDLESSGQIQKINLSLFTGSSSYFSLNLEFQKSKSGWNRTGNGTGGSPETFKTIRAAVEPYFPTSLPPTLPWPLHESVADSIREGAEALCTVFENQGLLRTDGEPWGIRSIHYIRSFGPPREDLVRLDLACKEGRTSLAWAGTDWAYDGKFLRFLDATGGVPTGSTMENHAEVETIVTEWLTQDREIFERVKPQGKAWRTCEAHLPGVNLIYSQQPVHPFLAEYNMRVSIGLPDGRSRMFSLPMNTGGRTQILVYTGTTSQGGPALRMVSGQHFDMAFDLEALRIFPVGEFQESAYAGAFLEVSTPLTWFPSES